MRRKSSKSASFSKKLLPGMTDKSAYIDFVVQFGLSKHYPDVLALAQQNADGQVGVNAVKALIDAGQQNLLRNALAGKDSKASAATAQALSTAADARAVALLMPFLQNNQADLETRRQAVRGVARTRNGARALLKLARDKSLSEDLKSAAAAVLTTAPWKDVKAESGKLFPLPPGKGDVPLPAFAELVENARRRRREARSSFRRRAHAPTATSSTAPAKMSARTSPRSARSSAAKRFSSRSSSPAPASAITTRPIC